MSEQVLFHRGVLEEVNGELLQIGGKCGRCHKTVYPPTERCPACASDQMERVPLSKVGKVFSFSVTRVPVAQYKPPMIGAYVDLPEGTRVFGQIKADPEKVSAGMEVRVETGVLWVDKSGAEVIGYYYVPVGSQEGGSL